MRNREENVVYYGNRCVIEYAITTRNKMPAREFFYALGDKDQDGLMAYFKLLGDSGQIRNPERFKKVEGEIWEFKRFQIRILCFMEPRGKVVLTHGFIKKSGRCPREEIRRANRIRSEHLSRRR